MGTVCERYREALSARLDGEEAPGERAATDAHLAGCADCRRWLEDATKVTRLARISPARPIPDLSGPILAAVGATRRKRPRLLAACRILLGIVGTAQILVAIAQTAAPAMSGMTMPGSTEGATAGHLLHESAAWNLAVGAGFLFIAWRRTRAAALVPLLTAFVGALTLLSADDLFSGMVAWSRLASHVLLLAGYLLVVVLSRATADPDGPSSATGRRSRRWRLTAVEDDPVPAPTPLRRLPPAHARHGEAA
jgi:predicted anti-sigma-YlaC factor YlaD